MEKFPDDIVNKDIILFALYELGGARGPVHTFHYPIGRLDCSAVFHHDGVLIGDFRKAWESALLIAGVGKKLVHDFRRTAVRNLMRAGNPEKIAMTLTGHKTRAIFDRYNIVSEADLAYAKEKLYVHLSDQPKTSTVTTVLSQSA